MSDEDSRKDEFGGHTVRDTEWGHHLIEERLNNFPKVGEDAPDFDLPLRGKKERIQLGKFRGRCPVVLIFGSLT